MAKYLSIVETAYRATLEEQDDTGVWFTHAMKNGGADAGILLRGNAVNYAVKGQSADGLTLGQWKLSVPPTIDKDLAAFISGGAPVYVVQDDLAVRGLSEADLIEGVKPVPRSDIASLVNDYDRVLHW